MRYKVQAVGFVALIIAFVVTVTGRGATLAEALDETVAVFTSTGDVSWFAQSTNTYDGVDAAQSGAILRGQTSGFQATVTNAKAVYFLARVDGFGGADILHGYVNGLQLLTLSGHSGWSEYSFNLSGVETVKWLYLKDSTLPAGSDAAWVDQVLFVFSNTPPQIRSQPAPQTNAVGTQSSFAVIARGGAPMRYQWQFNTTNLVDATNASITISNLTFADVGSYRVIVTNSFGSATSSVVPLIVTPSFPEALDTPSATWTTDGSGLWITTTNTTHDGIDAAECHLPQYQTAGLGVDVIGPGIFSFWWKLAQTNSGNSIEYLIDNSSIALKFSSMPWTMVSTNLPAGTHTIHWIYRRNFSSDVAGEGAWLDQVSFVPSPVPQFLGGLQRLNNGAFQFTFTNLNDANFSVLATTNIALPSTQWFNLGPPTLISNHVYQFTDFGATNTASRFFLLRSP